MTATAGRWAATTASVRGSAHDRDGRPNQDAVRVVEVGGPAPGLVAAVCDGHGGQRYVRSDVGSRLGVEVTCHVGRRALQHIGPTASAAVVEAQLRGPVIEAIVAGWRERVMDDVTKRPFTDEEVERSGTTRDADPLIAYGCTLVMAIVAPAWTGLLQIGDGDVTVVRGTRADSPVPHDARLMGGETTSLCLPTATSDARVSVAVEPLPDIVVLTSDGYANSFASPTWRADAGLDLRDQVSRLGIEGVEGRLPAWLADSAAAGGDDVSMALIQRVDAFPPPHSAAAPPPARERRRRAWLPAGVAVVAGLAGLGIGVLLADRGNTQAGADPSTSTVAVAPSVVGPTAGTTATTVGPTTTLHATTTTTTGRPITTTTAPVSGLVLSNGATPLLLLGPPDEKGRSVGVVVVFDPTRASDPDAVAPRFLADVEVIGRQLDLNDWAMEPGELSYRGSCHPAVAALLFNGHVWTISADRRVLTWYHSGSGAEIGHADVEGAPAASATKGDGAPGCATAQPEQGGAGESTTEESDGGDTSAPSTIKQREG